MYARISRPVTLMAFLLLAAGATRGWAQTLSGRVYEGRTGVEPAPAGDAQPLAGVTVSLYGSNDQSDDGTGGGRLPIQTTTTNSDGWYSLTVRGAYDYYNIIQTNLSGYVDSEPSPAATSVGGAVKSSNWIQYGYGDIFVTPATMTGNKFWDQKEGGRLPENSPPVAQDDSATTSQGTTVTINVLANDTDPDGDALHVNSATNPSHGTTVNHGSNVTYTPDPGFTGTDTFDYTAGDGRGGTDTATVTVTVERGAEPPSGTGTLDGYKRDVATGAGLANWRIYIDRNANGRWDSGEPNDLTDGNGYYRIPDVEPGSYRVCEEMQAGWQGDHPCVEGVAIVAGVTTKQDFHNRRIEPPEPQYDYGDAPLPYPEASHLLGGPYLGLFGDAPDAETGMQRDMQALGDDNDAGGDDENGLLSINLVKTPGAWSTWELKGYFAGSRDAGFGLWIDLNSDGDWDDPDELRAQFGFCGFGTGPQDWFHALGAFPLPAAAKVGTTYARLRVYGDCNATVAPAGAGGPGEVEDFLVEIKADGPGVPPGGIVHGYKWHDLNGNGLWDILNPVEPPLAGWTIWLDTNHSGQQDVGDMTTQTDAQGHFRFMGVPAGTYTLGEQLQSGWTQTTPGGTGTYAVTVQPGQASFPQMFGNTQREGPPPDTPNKLDWGDAPDPTYPTLRSSNGAYHVVVPGFCLGQAIDDEADGRPAADALGDDLSGTDDEDGVVVLTPLMPGGTAEVQITVSGAGIVDGWVDFDGDGSWGQPGDQILKSRSVTSGTHILSVPIPASAQLNLATFARFRLSRTSGLGPDGPAQAGEVEDYQVLIGPEGPSVPGVPGTGERAHLKWSQPPLEIDPNVEKPPVFCGWNEPARSTQSAGQRRQWRMDADDFRSLGPIPVTRIRWWGGYKGWDRPEPPETQPQAWHLDFWANQVEGLEADQLYPERIVWSVEVPNERVGREPVGLGEFPQQLAEMCFACEVRLEPSEWFPQAEFPTNAGVFWLSVTAIYPPDAESIHQWGWTSRSRVWGRGAVMPALMGEWPTFEERLFPGRITPVISSVLCGQSQPYDLCFELLTEEPWIKWDQPFTGLRDWPHYEDLESQGISIRQEETIGREVADDWACDGNAPVIAAAWWGSYLGGSDEPCRCDTQRQPRPDYFLLRMRTDAAGTPGTVVWEYRAFDYEEVSVGYDRYPQGEPNEPVFRYSVPLPEDNWFRPEGPGRTYWLSVTAMYVDPLPMLTHPWGWTSHRHVSGSGASVIDYRVEPPPAWRPLPGPEDQPIDTAFTLFTVPEP